MSSREMRDIVFVKTIDGVAQEIHDNNVNKGFWPDNKGERNFGEAIALVHSELSEALEGWRSNNPLSDKIGDEGFTQVEEEFADVFIRILDMCKGWDLRVGEAILAKMAYNEKRPHKHGKNF